MSGMLNKFAVLSLALATAACADAYEPKTQTTELKGGTVISNTASLAHTFIHAEPGKYHSCSLSQPDAAFDQADEGDISISLISVTEDQSEGGSNSENSEEAEMSGRTPTVLMARELFFRACEFSQNYKLNKKEALEIYNKTLDAVKEVWTVEAGNTTVTVGDTLAVTEGITVGSTSTQAISAAATTSNTTSDSKSDTTSDTTSATTEDTTSDTTSDTTEDSTTTTDDESSPSSDQ